MENHTLADHIAIKALPQSDLLFFSSQYRASKARGRKESQKGITLSANSFTQKLYPSLGSVKGESIPISVTVLGPGSAGAHTQERSISKSTKNWRLNGLVDDPADPDRYVRLVPNDLAVIGFAGNLRPETVTVVLVTSADDIELHSLLRASLPLAGGKMPRVSREQLEALVKQATVPADHPIRVLLHDAIRDPDLVDAVAGDIEAVSRVRRQVRRKSATAADIEALIVATRRIGRDGEVLAWERLAAMRDKGELRDLKWSSLIDAYAPYDFEIVTSAGDRRRIEVKTTVDTFERTMHVSAAEMATAACCGVRYDIWRIYLIDNQGARLRIAEDVGGFAADVLAGLRLPAHVRPDAFSLEPRAIKTWGPEIYVERPDELTES